MFWIFQFTSNHIHAYFNSASLVQQTYHSGPFWQESTGILNGCHRHTHICFWFHWRPTPVFLVWLWGGDLSWLFGGHPRLPVDSASGLHTHGQHRAQSGPHQWTWYRATWIFYSYSGEVIKWYVKSELLMHKVFTFPAQELSALL